MLCRRCRRAVRTMISRILNRLWSSVLWRWLLGLFPRRLVRFATNSLQALGWIPVDETPRDPENNEGQPEAAGGSERDDDDDDGSDSREYDVDSTDELHCDYDSTWDNEEQQKSRDRRSRVSGGMRSSRSRNYKFSRFENAAKDMFNYRHDYPFPIRQQYRHHNSVSHDDMPNLKFYLGQRQCDPDGLYISDFHTQWDRDYDKLEGVHTYIQWLFPLQEPGMNFEAPPLTKEEIKEFCENRHAKNNLLMSYKLMLDFYGIELCDEETGRVKRASNWRERFNNLDSHTHNNLRITRILKCLGTLGYRQYQYPLVHFFLEETLVKSELPRIRDSVLNYFVFAVHDQKKRRRLIKFAYRNYYPKEEFVWCPRKVQKILSGAAQAREGNQTNIIFQNL